MADPLAHQEVFQLLDDKKFFEKLVNSFYELVEGDEVLRPMYPEDLTIAKRKLYLFLQQRFGGPRDYERLRGHARLRRRHMKFDIDFHARDRWIEFMKNSLRINGIDEDHKLWITFTEYFERVATKMINSGEFQNKGINLL